MKYSVVRNVVFDFFSCILAGGAVLLQVRMYLEFGRVTLAPTVIVVGCVTLSLLLHGTGLLIRTRVSRREVMKRRRDHLRHLQRLNAPRRIDLSRVGVQPRLDGYDNEQVYDLSGDEYCNTPFDSNSHVEFCDGDFFAPDEITRFDNGNEVGDIDESEIQSQHEGLLSPSVSIGLQLPPLIEGDEFDMPIENNAGDEHNTFLSNPDFDSRNSKVLLSDNNLPSSRVQARLDARARRQDKKVAVRQDIESDDSSSSVSASEVAQGVDHLSARVQARVNARIDRQLRKKGAETLTDVCPVSDDDSIVSVPRAESQTVRVQSRVDARTRRQLRKKEQNDLDSREDGGDCDDITEELVSAQDEKRKIENFVSIKDRVLDNAFCDDESDSMGRSVDNKDIVARQDMVHASMHDVVQTEFLHDSKSAKFEDDLAESSEFNSECDDSFVDDSVATDDDRSVLSFFSEKVSRDKTTKLGHTAFLSSKEMCNDKPTSITVAGMSVTSRPTPFFVSPKHAKSPILVAPPISRLTFAKPSVTVSKSPISRIDLDEVDTWKKRNEIISQMELEDMESSDESM